LMNFFRDHIIQLHLHFFREPVCQGSLFLHFHLPIRQFSSNAFFIRSHIQINIIFTKGISQIPCFFISYPYGTHMNFLSHYYYTQSTSNPYYTLGAVLPDLFRNHHHEWKFHEIDIVPDDEDMTWLLKGWLLHIEVDRIFHSSTPFAD